ncbi:Guanine nucleotide exchange factor for Cdc42p [Coemansia sp. RSA 988]|nr:Guanine nucleotide exchange factor for Cdc42p [Coemansia sp. RSA 988]
MTVKFAAKFYSFCMGPRKRSIGTYSDSEETSRAVSVKRQAYVSPYDRAVELLERLLCLSSISTTVYAILVDEKSQHSGACKDPTQPLKTLFGRGSTLNILVNELESPFVATIDLYEGMESEKYEQHQIALFWSGCVEAGLVTEAKVGRLSEAVLRDVHNAECFELMSITVAAILDVLQQRGCWGYSDPRCIRPRDMYPAAHIAGVESRHAVLAYELSRTEVAYVQDLEKLVSYADCISAQVDVDSCDIDLVAIFGHIREILALHRRFSMRIQYFAAMPLRNQLFDVCYQDLAHEFDVYSAFCAGREYSQRAYKRALPLLRQLVSDSDPVFDVPALFMRPVQRLAQYPILFQGIADALCEGCNVLLEQEDEKAVVSVVKSAYSAMQRSKRILTRANESTREALNETQSTQFFERLGDPLAALPGPQAFGRLLTSDRVSAQTGREFEDMEGYLFEHVLVLCRASSDQESRSSRIRRTISTLQTTIMSPALRGRREDRRRSGSSISSSTLSSPTVLRARSPVLSAQSPDEKLSLPSFQLPDIDTGCKLSLTSPSVNPLSSHASLNTLRERPLIKFASSPDADLDEDCVKIGPRLVIRERIPTSAISQISQLCEVDGTSRLNIQAMMNDGSDVMLVFRQLGKECAAVWIRMLKRAVPLVPVEEDVALPNENYRLLVNPRFGQIVLGKTSPSMR